MNKAPPTSYGQIFRSTAFTGGASVISLGLGVIRTKAMAVLLGPAGIGLAGVYVTIIGLASTLCGMGIGSSGVRQIAESAGSGDELRIARTIRTLRRTAIVLGVSGGLMLGVLGSRISLLTFGDYSHAWAIGVLGLVVFFGAVSAGQVALIQGLRRIADLARLSVLGPLAGTVLGLPLVWLLGERGIVPLLVVVSATSLLSSWWIVRTIPVSPIDMSLHASAIEARALLGLGMAFMASGLMTAGAAYLIRLLLVRDLGLEAAGYYGAAYTISGIYAGFILQSMGADFYPRITAVATDHQTLNRLVNEQTEIALLMAVPGVLATMVFAPWVIHLFYAGGFDPAATVLQWQILGVLGRVISWPMGFILLAKGLRGTFLWTEIAVNVAHASLVWLGVRHFGLAGSGMAFAAMYLFHGLLMVAITRRATRFRWSPVNMRLLAILLPLVAIAFLARQRLNAPWPFILGVVLTVTAGWICLKGLLRRIPPARLGFLARWF